MNDQGWKEEVDDRMNEDEEVEVDRSSKVRLVEEEEEDILIYSNQELSPIIDHRSLSTLPLTTSHQHRRLPSSSSATIHHHPLNSSSFSSTSSSLENPPKSISPSPSRTISLSSLSFSFSTHLLPLTQSLETNHQHSLLPNLSTLSAIALVISLQIGSGIFSSPGILSQNCGSPGASLIVWLIAGILAWTGASSFAELGSAIPVNGGAQAYLNYSFGGWASYLFVWTNLVAIKPGSAAIISIVGSEYLCRILYHTAFKASPSESARSIPLVVIKVVAIFILFLVTSINGFSVKAGRHAPIILSLLKLLSLISIIIMAIVRWSKGLQSDNFSSQNVFNHTSRSPSDYALALYSGLWAFDGWDAGNYIAGELKKASKTLPIVIHSSMGIVLTLMLLTNWSYLVVLPLQLVTHSNTIALDFGRVLLGPIGGLIFSLIVAISCLGALNSSVFTTCRLVAVAAKEGYIPKVFARINQKTSTPLNALGLQAILTMIMIGFGDFKSLVGFYGTCAWSFYLLTVGSLLLLRVREPGLDRPYQTWLINPITFLTVASFLLLMPIFSAPIQSLAAFGFIVSGLPFYYLTTRKDLFEKFGRLGSFDFEHLIK